jgi:hypothetical protein
MEKPCSGTGFNYNVTNQSLLMYNESNDKICIIVPGIYLTLLDSAYSLTHPISLSIAACTGLFVV